MKVNNPLTKTTIVLIIALLAIMACVPMCFCGTSATFCTGTLGWYSAGTRTSAYCGTPAYPGSNCCTTPAPTPAPTAVPTQAPTSSPTRHPPLRQLGRPPLRRLGTDIGTNPGTDYGLYNISDIRSNPGTDYGSYNNPDETATDTSGGSLSGGYNSLFLTGNSTLSRNSTLSDNSTLTPGILPY